MFPKPLAPLPLRSGFSGIQVNVGDSLVTTRIDLKRFKITMETEKPREGNADSFWFYVDASSGKSQVPGEKSDYFEKILHTEATCRNSSEQLSWVPSCQLWMSHLQPWQTTRWLQSGQHLTVTAYETSRKNCSFKLSLKPWPTR